MNKEKIKQYLAEKDKKLLPLITLLPYPVNHRSSKDVYGALLYSIVSQQLSVKAVETIHERLLNLFDNNDPKPEALLKMSFVNLQSAGLSKQKVSYVQAIAQIAYEGGLIYEKLSKKSDEELIKHLTKIHGVGQWTVEMLLMFVFNRKNIFPVADVGIQNTMRKLYGLEEEGRDFKKKLILIAEQWQPYRTVVTRYLWAWKSKGYVKN